MMVRVNYSQSNKVNFENMLMFAYLIILLRTIEHNGDP